jgi:hypothetical protein
MTRYKASAIHFLGSACVLFLIFALVRWIWYPGPLFFAASGANLIGIVAAVDVILGPLIMLIIFNPKKSSLKFDVAVVLLCQIGFMLYGAWSIFAARPVYMVFAENTFHLVTANEIEAAAQAKANPPYRAMPWFGPQIVGVKGPQDEKKREEILFAGMVGMGIQNLPEYFIPYADVMPQAKAAGKMIKALPALEKSDDLRLTAFQAGQQAQGKQILFVPMRGKQRRLFVAIDAATGDWIDVL